MARGAIVFKLVGVLIGLAFVAFGWSERSSVNRIKSFGQEAIVQPIQNYTKFSQRGNDTYTAEFKFKTAHGHEITAKRSFPEEVLKDFQANRPVKIFYDPRDPSEFVFEKQRASSWWPFAVGGVIIVGSVILL